MVHPRICFTRQFLLDLLPKVCQPTSKCTSSFIFGEFNLGILFHLNLGEFISGCYLAIKFWGTKLLALKALTLAEAAGEGRDSSWLAS